MKVELFSTIEELKADRIPREYSDKEIVEQKKFVSYLRKVRKRNLIANESKASIKVYNSVEELKADRVERTLTKKEKVRQQKAAESVKNIKKKQSGPAPE